jgi:hypothetical protein
MTKIKNNIDVFIFLNIFLLKIKEKQCILTKKHKIFLTKMWINRHIKRNIFIKFSLYALDKKQIIKGTSNEKNLPPFITIE